MPVGFIINVRKYVCMHVYNKQQLCATNYIYLPTIKCMYRQIIVHKYMYIYN